MFTRRAIWIAITAFLFYFFANQTQVGWLYVMSALMLATLLASAWLNRGMLRRLAMERAFGTISETNAEAKPGGDDIPIRDLYEGDPLQISLTLRNPRRSAAWQVSIIEQCPLASPETPQHRLKLYAPVIPGRSTVTAKYDVIIDRRGLHEFPVSELTSAAPFGFFRRHREVKVISRVLVFPEVRRVSRLDLLDDRLAPEMTRLRVGYSTEVIGTRPFRSGDSPRHIHWRSTARQGTLISKEFADDAQPGLALVLDVFSHPYPETASKHTPFEWAVKVAATLSEYATQRNYPLTLVADEEALAIPSGQVSWMTALQYLARIQPAGHKPIAEILTGQHLQSFYAVILPWPDPAILAPLSALKQRGVEVMVVLLNPETFPVGGSSACKLADDLVAAGIETRLLSFDEDWVGQLQPQTVQTKVSQSTAPVLQ